MARRLILIAVAVLALAAPAGASAARVVNGDFESGNLAGWEVRRAVGAGNWFAYKGTAAPIEKDRGDEVQPPPQGTHAAIADQVQADTLLLFQDLRLEPGSDYRLSLLAYFNSYAAIAIPAPDTLSVDEEAIGSKANQQFRIDVIKPDAPLDSVAPGDVLRTLFRAQEGGPRAMKPSRFAAELGAFAGQTVRLRIAVAATEEVLYAGVDDVALTQSDGGRGGSAAGRIRIGKPRANVRRGTVRLPVRVPSAGRLLATAPGGKMRRLGRRVKAEGTVAVLQLRPTARGRKVLENKQRMRVKVRLRWTAGDGAREVVRVPVTFRLKIS